MSIAIVLSISGQAWARDASGNLRELSVGDTLREGETVVTSQGGGVELDFGDNTAPTQIQGGEQVVLTPELNAEELLEPSEFAALDQDIEALLAALDDETIDLLDVLDATAAGAGGGGAADGGHNFVRLARIAEGTGAQSFEFGSVSATDIPAVEEAGAAPQAALDELPSEPLNGVPNALDDFFSTDEESLLSGVNVLDNDSDPDGDALSISDPGTREITFVGPDGLIFTATVVLGADGFLSLDPRGGFDALAVGEQATGTFTYTVADGRGGFSTAKVTLTIVGTNDAPVIGGVASGEVTEDGTTTTTGQLSVSDVDVSDTHTWSVQGANVGTYGSFSVDANGQWTYVLDNASPAVQGLITGQSVTDSFTVEVSDGKGGTDTQVVTVTIHGSDDGAVISGQDSGLVKEDEILSTGGKLDVSDPDAGQAVFVAQAATAGQYGSFTLGTDGTWSYVLNNTHASVQGLAVGESLSENFTVTTADGTTSSVTVTIQGTNDVPIIGGVASGEVTEDGTTTTTGQLSVSDVDVSDSHSWSVVGNAQGSYGSFSVDANGQWTYVLDNASPAVQGLITGQSVTDSFTVQVDDGKGGTDTQVVTVTIHGSDDGAVISGQDSGLVKEDEILSTGGKLDVTDPDAGQAVFLAQAATAGQYGSFTLGTDGTWSYVLNNAHASVQGLAVGESLSESFTVVTADGTTSSVTVTIQGTNDAPIIGGVASGEVTEDATVQTSGQLTVSDVDVSDSHSWSVVGNAQGTYGSFSVDANGQWTYVLDNSSPAVQGLITGQSVTDSFTVEVSDGKGGTDTQVVTVTIHGSDDGAIISGEAAGTVKEDEILSTGGKLDVSDPDAGQAVFVAQAATAGQYGSFTLGTDGTWSYVLNNAHASVQGLAVGESLSESFTVVTADGTTSSVTVTIQGTNDVPIIGGVASGEVTEDATLQVSGQLTVSDVDVSDSHSWSVVGNAQGSYGSFSVDANGQWTYVLDNASPAVQGLISGQSVTDSFTVEVSDGKGGTDTQVVTVTIHGTNDQAQVIVSATGVDSTVYEAGLISVENTSEAANGSFQVTATDGIAHITVGGQQFSLSQLQGFSSGSPSAAIVTPMGTLYLTGYSGTANAGTISYQYTLKEVQTHGGQGSATDGVLTDTIVVVVKGVGDSAMTGHLTIAIVDDVPQASNDLGGTVTEDSAQNVLSGNVLSNDSFGADGPAGGVATVNWNVSAAQLADIGQYGTLVLNTDGSWSFTLDNSLAKVQALKASDLLTFNLGYTITDGDGDSASATLGFSIRGADDSASVTVSTQGADSTVYEAGLTSLADTRETAGGSFQISASDGIATLNVMGQVFTLAQLQGFSGASPSAGIVTNMGTLYLTGFSGTATEGTVSYQYTLSAAQSHGAPGSATNNVLTDSISLSVSGVGGSSAGGTLSVAIIDDAPTFETIMNAIIANESGTTLSGLHDLTMGADGAGAIIVADPTIAGINGYIAYSTTAHADGSVTKLAKVNGIDFFTLTIKVDGTYDFTLHEARPSIVKTVNFGGVQGGKSVEQLILGDVVLRAVDSNGNNKIDNGEMISPSSAGFGVGNGNIDAGEKFIISFVNNKVIENIDFSYKHQGSTDFRMTWQSNTGETGTVGPISQDGWISINPAQDFTSITFTVLQGSGKIDGVKYGELVLPGDTFVNFDIHGIDADGDISATQTLSVKLLGAGSTSVAITGTAEDEVIVGTSANDTINGGEGNDILIGGAGNDTLIGGEGDDVFQWNFGDQGGVGSAAHDVVKDFSLGINTLDLADLLQGEAAETIDSFIFAVQEGSSTVLYVNHEGSIGANGSNATQVIVLENFSMDGASSTDFLQVMLENGQLHIDQ